MFYWGAVLWVYMEVNMLSPWEGWCLSDEGNRLKCKGLALNSFLWIDWKTCLRWKSWPNWMGSLCFFCDLVSSLLQIRHMVFGPKRKVRLHSYDFINAWALIKFLLNSSFSVLQITAVLRDGNCFRVRSAIDRHACAYCTGCVVTALQSH